MVHRCADDGAALLRAAAGVTLADLAQFCEIHKVLGLSKSCLGVAQSSWGIADTL